VLEALRSGRSVDKVFLLEKKRDSETGEIVALCRALGIPFHFVPREKLDILAGEARHQGAAALAPPREYASVDDIIEAALRKREAPLILALNKVQDPHNLGSIIRTAEAAGIHGIIVPERHSCPLTPAVSRAAAGADAYVPLAKVGNLSRELEELKKRGLWIAGADRSAELSYEDADLTVPSVLVLGGEDAGLGRAVRAHCDLLIRIPMKGRISSLNVGVSAGILLFECLRQRRSRAAPGLEQARTSI
jgi:23S rRNA (guanosine2251-2'-O)-methyltransferase